MTERARYQQAKRIFRIAADLQGDARADFVADAVDGDESLAALVRSLLSGDDRSDSGISARLEEGALKAAAGGDASGPSGSRSGTSVADLWVETVRHPERINKYAIVRKVAEGGMGVVYEATSENPNRRVALKVLREAHMTLAARKRFQFEIDILAQLEHPGIGRLYDSGTTQTEGGLLQYLAMEYIDGADLLTHADERGLNARERLVLFAGVLDAVHYAHQKGVIHRDLKPGNILVESESGMPKILDFGVARMVDADHRRATMTTDVGQLVGTLSYMSPEQIERDDGGIDIRTDVFALGVVLYELLAGRRPIDVHGLSIVEAGRKICEVEPTKLGQIDHRLSGDIETIVAKALSKRRTERYQSVMEFGGDIRRHLENRPITARPPSVVDAMSKFARRHAGLVAGMAIALVFLVAGTVISTSLAISEGRLRAIAESKTRLAQEESEKAKSVVSFLEDMFAAVDPELSGRPDVTVLEFLDTSAHGALNEKAFDSATTRAAVLLVLGNAYVELGYGARAAPLLEDAYSLISDDTSVPVDERLKTLRLLARAKTAAGALKEGEALARDALDHHLEHYGRIHPRTALAYNNLALNASAQGDYERAAELHRASLEIRRQLGDFQNLAGSLSSLAGTLHRLGRYDEALMLFEESLAMRREHLPKDHPRIATTLNNLGSLYQELGQLDKAGAMLQEALAIRSRILPDAHPLLAVSYNNVGTYCMRCGQWEEARIALERAINIHRKLGQGDHPDVAKSMTNLATVLAKLGDNAGAAEMQKNALVNMRAHLGPDHPSVAMAMHNAAYHQRNAGDTEGAIATLGEAMVILKNRYGQEHALVAHCYHSLAVFCTELGRLDEATLNVKQCLSIRKRVFQEVHPLTAAAYHDLAYLSLLRGTFDEARNNARHAVALRRRLNQREELIQSLMILLRAELAGPDVDARAIVACLGELAVNTPFILLHANQIPEWLALHKPRFAREERIEVSTAPTRSR